MPKRFIDTELWGKPWFFELTPTEKLAFIYIMSECDAVGVWTCNFRMAEFTIGSQLDWNKFAGKCNGNIDIISDTKWWLVDYCIFQHGDLSPEHGEKESKNNAVKGYVKLLRKHNLWQRYVDRYVLIFGASLDPVWGQLGPQEKGIGNGKGKRNGSNEKSRSDSTHELGVPINTTTYQALLTDYGKVTTDSYIERVIDYCASRGKSYRDYAATARQWMRKDEGEGKLQRRVKIERPPRVFGNLPDSSE